MTDSIVTWRTAFQYGTSSLPLFLGLCLGLCVGLIAAEAAADAGAPAAAQSTHGARTNASTESGAQGVNEPVPGIGSAERPEEIVVTASPSERSADQLAVPIDLVQRDELLDESGGTLGERLRSRVGVTTTSFAAGASRPVIRGQDQLRVRVLENGIGTGDASSISADHGVTINPLVTQRVEVVRGPASLRYGGGAIGGVVNALTSRIASERIGAPLASELFTAYGTGSRERALAGVVEGDAGPISWHVDAFSQDSGDYRIPGRPSRQRNTATDGYSFSGGAAWFSERVRLGAAVTRFRNVYGIPAPEDPAEPARIDLEQDHYAFELDVTPGGDWIDALRVRGARTEYRHDEKTANVGVTSTFDTESLELRTELLHGEILGFSGAFGVQCQDTDFQADGEGADLLPPSETRLVGVYLFESLPISDRLDLELAGRLERVAVEGTSPAGQDERHRFAPRSASAALLYALADDWSVGLTLTAAQRAPDALELFSQGPHDATETFELGDPGQAEETSYTADLLVRGAYGPLSGQVGVFATQYRDFTFGRLTGSSRDEDGTLFPGDPDAGELRDLIYTQDDATFRGAEVEARLELGELGAGDLALELQADFVRARLSSGNVPRIPPLRYGLKLVYDSPRLSGHVGFLRAEAQNELADFEERTSGYTSVDGTLRLRLAGTPEQPIDLTLSVRNLLDARSRNHVSFKKRDVLLPGRDLRMGLHIRF